MSSQPIWFKWRPPSSRFAERFISHVFIIGNLLSTKCENTNLYEGCTLLEEEDGTAEEQEEGEMGRGGRRRIGELEVEEKNGEKMVSEYARVTTVSIFGEELAKKKMVLPMRSMWLRYLKKVLKAV